LRHRYVPKCRRSPAPWSGQRPTYSSQIREYPPILLTHSTGVTSSPDPGHDLHDLHQEFSGQDDPEFRAQVIRIAGREVSAGLLTMAFTCSAEASADDFKFEDVAFILNLPHYEEAHLLKSQPKSLRMALTRDSPGTLSTVTTPATIRGYRQGRSKAYLMENTEMTGLPDMRLSGIDPIGQVVFGVLRRGVVD